jgi:hypothetical protein
MVHGVSGSDLTKKDADLIESIKRIRRDFGATRGDIFFQFGFLDEVEKKPTKELKSDEKYVASYVKQKEKMRKHMRDAYGLVPSWREHMPDTTVKITLSHGIQEVRK